MENKGNTNFYNVYNDLQNKDKYTKYQKNKNTFYRFLIRLEDDDIDNLKDVFEIYPCKKQTTMKKGGTRDKTEEYDFTFPYDNTLSSDMNSNHCNIVCNKEDIEEIQKLLSDKFKDGIKFGRK